MSHDPAAGKVFVSYIREDRELVDTICRIFDENNVPYWIDRAELTGGDRWKRNIRDAIRRGAYFLSVNTPTSARKPRSGAREELLIAVEELRLRSIEKRWFIPLRFDSCDMPDNDIGGGETLASFQWIDVERLGWVKSMEQLLKACGVPEPRIGTGAPLGEGLPPILEMLRGTVTYERTEPPDQLIQGLINAVQGGLIARDNNGRILARFNLMSATSSLQRISEEMGMAELVATCSGENLSTDPAAPSAFVGMRQGTTSRQVTLNAMMGRPVVIPANSHFRSAYTAKVHVNGDRLRGNFRADVNVTLRGTVHSQSQYGTIDVVVSGQSAAGPVAVSAKRLPATPK